MTRTDMPFWTKKGIDRIHLKKEKGDGPKPRVSCGTREADGDVIEN